MAKLGQKVKKDSYAQEMSLWLAQQRIRLKSCRRTIANNLEEIAINKQLVELDQRVRRIIQQSIKDGEKELAEYLAEKKRSKKKISAR